MPQIAFENNGFGTSLVTVDGVCESADDTIETIKPIDLLPQDMEARRADAGRVDFTVESLKTKRTYTVPTEKGSEVKVISLEQPVQIFKVLGTTSNSKSNRTFIGTKVYTIPSCELVR
jgi:hypothetical protein